LGPVDPRQIQAELGHAFLANAKALGVTTPSDADGVSSLLFLEDGRALTGGRQHEEIRKLGGGRFSHWGPHIYFSSTDNSDPRTNGRSYTVLVPRSLLGSLAGTRRDSPHRRRLVLMVGMAAFALSFAAARPLARAAGQVAACAGVAALSGLSLPASLLGLVGVAILFASSSAPPGSGPGGTARFPSESLGVFLVALAALALGLLHARALATTPVGWDEGIMLAQTEHLLQGQRLYADVMAQYPPGIYIVLTAVLTLWHHIAAARLLAGLLHLGIALLVGVLARRLSPDPLAPWSAAALWLACATAFEADTLMSDPFSTLPALGALVCLAPEAGGLPSFRRAFLAGMLVAAGALCKQMGILWVLPVAVWLLVWPKASLSNRLQRLGVLGAGCAFVGVPTLLILAGRPRALFCTIVFPLSDRYPSETTMALLFQSTFTPDRWTVVLPVLLVAVLVLHRLGSSARPPASGLHVLLWLIVLISVYPFSKRAYAHYALPALAALAALAGGGIGRLHSAAQSGGRRLAVALLITTGLMTIGQAARSINATHTANGFNTLEDDTRLVSSLQTLAPEGAPVICTWPFAMFANRYRSPVRFHYDLAFTVPGEFWLEEWRDLGRKGSSAAVLVVRSRRNVYDTGGSLWKQLVPEESLTPSAQEPVLRSLVLPPVLWYAREGDRDLRLAVAGAPGAFVAVRGSTDADELAFESDWGEPTHVAVRPAVSFRVLFPVPKDSWHLARVSVGKGRRVLWEGASQSAAIEGATGYDSGAVGATR
jgi:4-amino-4-deoxy-L-arabinose transferase-like glycosyltransferase